MIVADATEMLPTKLTCPRHDKTYILSSSFSRTKYESQEKQLTLKVTTLEKEKSALKSQLTDLINELTQVY